MAKKKPSTEVLSEQPKALTKAEILEMRALQAEMRLADLQAQMRILEREAFMKEVDPKNRFSALSTEIRKQSENSRYARETLEKLQKSIEDRLQISLKEWAYNDETGELSKLDS